MTLSECGLKYETDKGTTHSYLDIYEPIFEPFRYEPLALFELGTWGGGSLRMWLEWFPKFKVYGIDNNEESIRACRAQIREHENRSSVRQIEQTDIKSLKEFIDCCNFAVIIDDASHVPIMQLQSFMVLWKHVLPGGYYIVEDINNDDMADYWAEFPGTTVYRSHKNEREDDILVIIKKDGTL